MHSFGDQFTPFTVLTFAKSARNRAWRLMIIHMAGVHRLSAYRWLPMGRSKYEQFSNSMISLAFLLLFIF
ncbi:hypothetical protein BGP77_15690 [Saccharospirillum sp. MSK14-1]|nr:hypothetical protein BGP77_15690 [Saccharospirillum sp. MSK14-1]